MTKWWLAFAAFHLGIACAGARRGPDAITHDVVTVKASFTSGAVVIPVPKGWSVRQLSSIGFEGGHIYDIGSEGRLWRCNGEIVVDSYDGFGLLGCGATSTVDVRGSLFGALVIWKTGQVPLPRCGEMFWSRALLPGTQGEGIQLFARSHDHLEQLMGLVSGMRVEGDDAFDAKTPVEQEEHWSFSPESCLRSE